MSIIKERCGFHQPPSAEKILKTVSINYWL